MTELCPCGSNQPYEKCCAPLHLGAAHAQTAEQLMRSRYSAFAKRLPQYLVNTLHPSKRAPDELALLEKSVALHHWISLQIVSKRLGNAGDEEGYVAFRATYDDNGSPAVLEENSTFINESGHWYYLSGQFPPQPLPGRNEPCWCGSDKKYKKCHG